MVRRTRYRNPKHLCPNCMSSMKLDEKGKYKCTGDRLNLWKKEFERFEKMNTKEREDFLKGIENIDKFMELFNKRLNLECDYSSRMVDITPTYSVEIPDPMHVSKIEKALGRRLTELELEEGYKFYTDGNNIFSEKKEGTRYFFIERIIFPDEAF